MDMQVGENFNLVEFTVSQTASRRKIDNTPGEAEINNIRMLCKYILDPLHAALKEKVGPNIKIIVNSGYRSHKLNSAVGGARTSQHTKGEAADIVVPGCTNQLIIALIQQLNLPVDQVIDEFGDWVHVSFNIEGGRRQYMKATQVARRKVVYTMYGSGGKTKISFELHK